MSRILGLQIDAYCLDDALSEIKSMLNNSSTDYVVTVNPEFLVRAEKNSDFKQVLRDASLRTSDGVGVSLFSKFSLSRASGVDIMLALAEELEASSKSFFLFGASQGVAKKAAQNLKSQFPNLDIAGTLDGVQADKNSNVETIRSASPDLLFVALGAQKQEQWIADHKEELSSCRVAIGVGGAFDILAGVKSRAPKFLREAGLEWFWRFVLEPSRAPRIYEAVVYFPYLIFKQKISTLNEQNKPTRDK